MVHPRPSHLMRVLKRTIAQYCACPLVCCRVLVAVAMADLSYMPMWVRIILEERCPFVYRPDYLTRSCEDRVLEWWRFMLAKRISAVRWTIRCLV